MEPVVAVAVEGLGAISSASSLCIIQKKLMGVTELQGNEVGGCG